MPTRLEGLAFRVRMRAKAITAAILKKFAALYPNAPQSCVIGCENTMEEIVNICLAAGTDESFCFDGALNYFCWCSSQPCRCSVLGEFCWRNRQTHS